MPLENINLSSVGNDSDEALLDQLRHLHSKNKHLLVSQNGIKPEAKIMELTSGGSWRLKEVVPLTHAAVSAYIVEHT